MPTLPDCSMCTILDPTPYARPSSQSNNTYPLPIPFPQHQWTWKNSSTSQHWPQPAMPYLSASLETFALPHTWINSKMTPLYLALNNLHHLACDTIADNTVTQLCLSLLAEHTTVPPQQCHGKWHWQPLPLTMMLLTPHHKDCDKSSTRNSPSSCQHPTHGPSGHWFHSNNFKMESAHSMFNWIHGCMHHCTA